MIRTAFVAIILSFAGPAHSQTPPPSFEMLGIKATDQQAGHAARFEKCEAAMNFTRCTFAERSFAGEKGTLEAGWASDGSLLQIHGYFAGKSYDAVLAELETKWGKPARFTEVEEKGPYDVISKKPISVWVFAEGELTLTGRGGANAVKFEFETPARRAYLDSVKKPAWLTH